MEAIEAFRAQLVVYLAQMRPVLEEITSEVLRTRSWLEDDRRRHWQQECRGCAAGKLEDARQELFTATLSQHGRRHAASSKWPCSGRSATLRAAEEKLAVMKKWDRELDNRTAPLVKQMEQLHGFLTVEMERAVAYLDQAIRALDAYRNVRAAAGGRNREPRRQP